MDFLEHAYAEGVKVAAAGMGLPALPRMPSMTPAKAPTFTASNRQAGDARPADGAPKLPMVTGKPSALPPFSTSAAITQQALGQTMAGIGSGPTPKVAFAPDQHAFNYELTVTPDPDNKITPDNGSKLSPAFGHSDPTQVVNQAFNSINAQKPTDLINGGGEAYVGSPGI